MTQNESRDTTVVLKLVWTGVRRCRGWKQLNRRDCSDGASESERMQPETAVQPAPRGRLECEGIVAVR